MHSHRSARGMALISALLLLVVMTVLGVAMFRSFGTLERIAGNTREKQRAFSAATSTQTFGEGSLMSSGGINATAGTNCPAGAVTAPATIQVCSNVLANVSRPDLWPSWMNYTPPMMSVGGSAGVGTPDNYIYPPAFYIAYLGGSYDASQAGGTQTNTYQVDAAGYAGNANSVAVTESTYSVSVIHTSAGPPQPGHRPKRYITHGGP
jgi:type IV pilus assembly protein PilX